jgi:hypothetical protein
VTLRSSGSTARARAEINRWMRALEEAEVVT